MARFCWRPSCLVSRLSCRHWELLFSFAARQSTLPVRASCLAAWFTFLPCWRCCDCVVADAVPDSASNAAAASTVAARLVSRFVEWSSHTPPNTIPLRYSRRPVLRRQTSIHLIIYCALRRFGLSSWQFAFVEPCRSTVEAHGHPS